jgi:hypothetical protein
MLLDFLIMGDELCSKIKECHILPQMAVDQFLGAHQEFTFFTVYTAVYISATRRPTKKSYKLKMLT